MKPLLRLLLASLATCSIGVSFAQPAADSVLADIAFHEKIAASAFSGRNRLKMSATPDSLDLDIDSCYSNISGNQHSYYRASAAERKLTDSTVVYDETKKIWHLQTIGIYYFNEAGRMSKFTETIWDEYSRVYWTRNEMIVEYAKDGQRTLISNRYRTSNGDEMRNTWRNTYKLDETNRIVEGRRYYGSGSIWNLNDMTQYEYDLKGNMTKSVDTWYTTTDSITPDSTRIQVHKYSFDDKGNIKTDTVFVNGRPSTLDVKTFTDEYGSYKLQYYKAMGAEWMPVGYNTIKFDAEGKNYESIYYGYIGDIVPNVMPDSKSVTTYDDNGKCTFLGFYKWNDVTKTWFPTQTEAHTYDRYGREVHYTRMFYNSVSGEFEITNGSDWYYKLKTESLQVSGGSQLTFSFDSKLIPNDSITKCIVILPTAGESVTMQVSRAYISETDPYTLIVELSRPLADGDAYTVSLKSGLVTEDGRSVKFSMDMGNAAAATAAPRAAVNETAVYPTIFHDELHVDADADISSVQITGINGTQWFAASQISASHATVSLSHLPAGMYRVDVSTPQSHTSHSIMKH